MWRTSRDIPHLRRYALALVRDREAADDLVQDSLERALKKRHLWRRQGSIRSWLFRVLYNVFLNQLSGRRRRRAAVPLHEVEMVIAEPPRQEKHVECRNIAEALDRLPPQQRAAIILIALEGLPYGEAAWVMGVPIGTLRSRLSRGRETLRAVQSASARHGGGLRRVK